MRRGCFAVMALVGVCGPASFGEETAEQRYVISVERIWDRAAHCAFTDLIAVGDGLYCSFREGSGHIPGLNGVIRVIRSRDGMQWESVAVLQEPGIDLRDPKLSITPDGRLMMNCGASKYHGAKRLGIESRVAFADREGRFGPPQKVEFPKSFVTGGDWLWRVTWHQGVAWGCVQQVGADRQNRALRLVRSSDGIHFDEVAKLQVDAPSETTLRFLPDETLVAMIRCEGQPPLGKIGRSKPPYQEWTFADTNERFGGPNFIELPGGTWLAGSRHYEAKGATTQLWRLDLPKNQFEQVLTLPSAGDNSYPGFVVDPQTNRLLMSYYSSHDGRTAIYLATLRLDALADPN